MGVTEIILDVRRHLDEFLDRERRRDSVIYVKLTEEVDVGRRKLTLTPHLRKFESEAELKTG